MSTGALAWTTGVGLSRAWPQAPASRLPVWLRQGLIDEPEGLARRQPAAARWRDLGPERLTGFAGVRGARGLGRSRKRRIL